MKILTVLLLASCTPEEGVDEVSTYELLSPRQQLIRLSVDLRGIHPTEAELQAIEEAPALYDAFADRWLEEDPRFIGRIKEIFNYRYLTRTGDTYFDLDERNVSNIGDRRMGDIIGDEPLALLEYVIENDLPYSYIVTAPHSMANPALAEMWDMYYPDGATGWQPAIYKDGRPHAGILSMKTIWERYPSMGGNANRHRANAISKMLLCDDYLSRPVVLNRAAVDQLTIDPEDAINVNASCQSCHSTLDPIAGNLFGFFNYDDDLGFERTIYRPENEEEWRYYSGKEPAYYGRPTANLVEFAEQIAEDQRFADCAVKTVFEGLTQREITDEDWSEIQPHENVFTANNQSIRELVRSIVKSDEYKAGYVTDKDAADRVATVKLTSPSQLESIIADKTGYMWTFNDRPGLSTNDRGLNVLMGGIDSRDIVTPTFVPSVGGVFVQERLAMSAGYHVARADLAPGREGDARLLKFVTIEDTPEANPNEFEAQIRELYLQLTGIPLDPEATEPAELMQLWKYQYSIEADPIRAWGSVVTAVLRDPTVVFY
ncbi:MAG: DUF1585 domain-containing protein [Alphaproteobacteria bacterium]|nr:DUF1585 domain-containing protein [Alphaproteobacteria bacterium]